MGRDDASPPDSVVTAWYCRCCCPPAIGRGREVADDEVVFVWALLTTPRADCFDEVDDDKAEFRCFGKEDITPILSLVLAATWLDGIHTMYGRKLIGLLKVGNGILRSPPYSYQIS